MLSISLEPDEYITIGDDIVVKVHKMARGRCFLGIEADRSVPIVRSAVRERSGLPAPECITPQPPRKKVRRNPDTVYRWSDDRERALRNLQKVADRLEESGDEQEAKIVRMQLAQLVPAAWENTLPNQ
jgi:hypothetical protein